MKIKHTLIWHGTHEPYPVPPEIGLDVQLLLKEKNLPMPYLTASWDGHNLHTFSTFGYPSSPWTPFPDDIEVEAWAILP